MNKALQHVRHVKTRATETASARKRHYEPIATAFNRDGFQYRQIAREGDMAIYEQRWPGSDNVCYEVVRIRRRKAGTYPNGVSYPPREVYPSSAQWGDDAWTVTTLDAAYKKLEAENCGDPLPASNSKSEMDTDMT
jgi:hypothetical protein